MYFKRFVSLFMSFTLIYMSMGPVQAAVINNSQLLGLSIQKTELMQALGRDTAKQQLAALGISQEQARQRIQQMTDQEVALLNQKLAELPAGGDVLGVALIIFIVFVITDALGATNLFTFVHPIK